MHKNKKYRRKKKESEAHTHGSQTHTHNTHREFIIHLNVCMFQHSFQCISFLAFFIIFDVIKFAWIYIHFSFVLLIKKTILIFLKKISRKLKRVLISLKKCPLYLNRRCCFKNNWKSWTKTQWTVSLPV